MSRPSRWWRSCERRSPLRRCPGRWKRATRSGCAGSRSDLRWPGAAGAASAPSRRSSARTRSRRRRASAPQPVCRRQAQIASSSSGASRCGLCAGRLERSKRQERLSPSPAPASRPRFHQRLSGRYRDVERPRRLTDRASALDREHQLVAPGKSELGVTVKLHPALLLGVVVADAQPGRRTGLPRQPFTTCVGGTSRRTSPPIAR